MLTVQNVFGATLWKGSWSFLLITVRGYKFFALRKVDDGRNVEHSDVLREMYEGSLLAEWSSSIPIGVWNFGRIQI